VLFGCSILFEDGGYHTVLIPLFKFTATDITIKALVNDHLSTFVSYMGHGSTWRFQTDGLWKFRSHFVFAKTDDGFGNHLYADVSVPRFSVWKGGDFFDYGRRISAAGTQISTDGRAAPVGETQEK
jgi:hypothetical protein